MNNFRLKLRSNFEIKKNKFSVITPTDIITVRNNQKGFKLRIGETRNLTVFYIHLLVYNNVLTI